MMRPTDSRDGERGRSVRNRNIVRVVLAGVVRSWLADPRQRHSQLLRKFWIELMSYAAPRVPNIELSQIRGIDTVRVEGPVGRHSPLVVTALSMLLECDTVFEFGRGLEATASLVAHNLPDAKVYLFDEEARAADMVERRDRAYQLPRSVSAVLAWPDAEAARIVRLRGDPATFNFVPYSGHVDLVEIDGSRGYAQVRSDTETAFGLLSELGAIVWDGYASDPGLYAYLNEIAPSLDRPIFHIAGTALALYSRWEIVIGDVL